MSDAEGLLAAYDAQLRGGPEVRTASRIERIGPLWIACFPAGRGFVSYRDLGGLDGAAIAGLVRDAVALLSADPEVAEAEWKTRGHDRAPGLHDALVAAGFLPQEPESVMIGAAALLADAPPPPEGVVLRSLTEEADVRRASAVADEIFGDPVSSVRADDLIARIDEGAELWVAEVAGEVISSGRVEPVPGTEFAGLWGGSTRAEWRGRGVYRALTARRAEAALRRGARYLTSDSTEFSRPILERSGLTKVTTTTPYEWHRDAAAS